MTERKLNLLNWVILIITFILALVAFTKISYGAWSITETRIGTYATELTVITSDTNVLRTNYIRSAGLMKCRETPLQFYPVILSNYLGGEYLGNCAVGCYPLNATNLLLFRPDGSTAATYIKFKVILNKPHNSIR